MGIWYEILESNKETEKPKESAFASAGTILLLGKEDYTKSFLVKYLKDEEKSTKTRQIRHYDWVSFGSTQAFNNAMMAHSSAKQPESKDASASMVPIEVDFLVIKPEDLKNPKPESHSGTITLGEESPATEALTDQTIQVFALNEPSFLNLVKPMFTYSELEKTVVLLTFPFDGNIEKNIENWMIALKSFIKSLTQKYSSPEDQSINLAGCQKKIVSYYQETVVNQTLVPQNDKNISSDSDASNKSKMKLADFVEKNTDIAENLGVPIIFVGVEAETLDKTAKELEKSSRYPTGGSLAEHFKNYVQRTIRNKALPYSASLFYLHLNQNSHANLHHRGSSSMAPAVPENPARKLKSYICHRLFGTPFTLTKENMLPTARELMIPSGFDTGLAIKSLDIFSLLTGEGKKTPAPLEKYFEKVNQLNEDLPSGKSADSNSSNTTISSTSQTSQSSSTNSSSSINVEKYEDFLKRMEKIQEEVEKKDPRKLKGFGIDGTGGIASAGSSLTSDENSNKEKDSDQEPADFFSSFSKKKAKTVSSSLSKDKEASKDSPSKVKKHVAKKEGTSSTTEKPPKTETLPKVTIQLPPETAAANAEK